MKTKQVLQVLGVIPIVCLGTLDRVTPSWGDVPPGCSPSEWATQFADVDGDGRADAIVINADKITVRRSTGTSFGAYESWTTYPYQTQYPTQFADVDGDGDADAIVQDNNAEFITVRRSTG